MTPDQMAANNPAAHATVPRLEVRDLRRSYGAVKAVDGLSYEVQPGSITGMIGPNGCGKTTSVNCVTGFDRGYVGEVLVDGKSIDRLSPDEVARAGVMRTFQAIRVFDDLTVLRNAMIGMQCFDGLAVWDPVLRTKRFRTAERAAEDRAAELIRTVGLGAKISDQAGSLSYGQKKLLALAGILMSQPRVVILDEPVAGVNPSLVHEIADVLRSLNDAGTTFLIIEHNIEFIMNLSHSVVVMDAGRCLASGSPSMIREDVRVLEAYLGGTDHATH